MSEEWKLIHPRATEYIYMLGFLPTIIRADDNRPAKEQVNARYGYGGGWRKFSGMKFNPDSLTLSYPGDPPMAAIAEMTTQAKERVILFQFAWVAIIQPDGSYEIARMD